MKNRLLIPTIVIGVALVAIYLVSQRRHDKTVLPQETEPTAENAQVSSNDMPRDLPPHADTPAPAAVATPAPTAEPSLAAYLGTSTQKLAEVRAQVQEYLRTMNQPINFDGQVTDQDGHPLSQASVKLSWSPYLQEVSFGTNLVTDSTGSFGLHGVEGYILDVQVTKEGYYSGKESRGSFRFGKETPSRPPPASGGITRTFRLYKKGPGTSLVTSQHGMSPELEVTTTDNLPTRVDLLTQRIDPAGQLEIVMWHEPKDFKTGQNTWYLRIAVPDGGVIENQDEFPYEAPDSGYVPSEEWSFTDGTPGWKGSIQKQFYIRFGTPPRFGRLNLSCSSLYSGASIGYAINPDGSRNLEPQ